MKKIGFLFLVVLVAAAAILTYFWREASYVPDWYSTAIEEGLSVHDGYEIRKAATKIRSKIDDRFKSDQKEIEIVLDAQEANDFLIASIANQIGGEAFLQAVKGSNTSIEEGYLKTGMIVNLSEMPMDNLDLATKEGLEQLMETFTFLKEKEVYVGIEGVPEIKDGQINLSNDLKIKLGGLSFTLSDISGKFGLPEEALKKSLNLRFGKMKIDNLEMKSDGVVIRGSAN